MHLFAGHGGGLLADLILGHTPIVAVEWDKYACKVLRERTEEWFPGLQVWEGDVRLFDPSEYTGKVDCIHAGFPCQDISVAGKQAGVGIETRSGLYREVLRIASVVRPRQLFLENVSAIVTNGLGTVLADLASLGYDTEWLCLRASDCGANHHRDRWWCLAHSRCELRQSRNTAELDSDKTIRTTSTVHHQSSCSGQNISNTNCPQCKRVQCSKRTESEHSNFGSSCWWETEPNVGRVADGVPNRAYRLKGLGNAQVPLQAAVAYKLLGGE